MAYSEKEKKSYLKYNKKTKKAGQTPQGFGKWRADQGYTSQTKGISDSLRRAGLSDDDINRLRDRKK